MNVAMLAIEFKPIAAHTSFIFPLVPRQATVSKPVKPKFRIKRSLAANPSLFVTIAPPSNVFMNFVAWKLNISASPKPPIILPL
jgi:hypothetical protein